MKQEKQTSTYITQKEARLRKNGQSFTTKSKTIQDDVLSIRELLNRYQRGEENPKQPIYDDESTHESIDFSKYKLMDIADQEELLTSTKQHITDTLTKIKNQKRDLPPEDQGKALNNLTPSKMEREAPSKTDKNPLPEAV